MTGFLKSTLFASAGLLALSSQAFAQEAAPTADASQIQEVVVTATRRAEAVQNIPIAVTVISGDQFRQTNFKNPIDLQYLSPSIQVSASGGIGFNVRGVGTNSFNLATEQTVGLSVDGVISGFVDDIGGDLSDAARVEVLRGPQGTQFGKNASGGLISITTKKPTFDGFHFDGRASYGEHNDTNDSLRINVPLSDTLAFSLLGSYQSRDGFIYNPVRKVTEGKQEQWALKGKLLWKPTDNFSIYTIVDYRFAHWDPNFLSTYRALGAGSAFPPIPTGLGIQAYGIVAGPENQQVGDAGDSFRHTGVGGISTEINYNLGDYTLTSLTAFRAIWRPSYGTLGGTPIVFVEGPTIQNGAQWSEELRLTSPAGKRLEYVAGLYYYNRSMHSKGLFAGPFGGSAPPGFQLSFSGGEDYSTFRVTSYAAFTDGTFHITDALRLIGGVRVGHDKAEASQYTVPLPGVLPLFGAVNGPSSGGTSATNYAFRIGPQLQLAPDVMAYATASRGYKGPIALPVAGLAVRQIRPEIVNSYEAGLKSSFWDRKATVNIAVFLEKFKDFQTSVLDNTTVPPSFVLGNAGGLKTQGIELETQFKPVAGLTFSGNVTYQDAKFTDFKTQCFSVNAPIKEGTTTNPSGVGGCYTPPGGGTGFTQAAGAPLSNASRWNYTLSASYEHEVGDFVFDISANYIFRSKFYTNGADPNTKIDGYGVAGLNMGLSPKSGRWRVGVFARNLFDQYYVSAVETGIFDDGALTNVINPEAHRTLGVQLEAHF